MRPSRYRLLWLYGAWAVLALTIFAWAITSRVTFGYLTNRADRCGFFNGAFVWFREGSEARYREHRISEVEFEMAMGWPNPGSFRIRKTPSPDPNRFAKEGAFWFSDDRGEWTASTQAGKRDFFPRVVLKWEWDSTITDPVSGAILDVAGPRHIAVPLWLIASVLSVAAITLSVRYNLAVRAIRHNRCGSCGYSLSGLPLSVCRCPECGVEAASVIAG